MPQDKNESRRSAKWHVRREAIIDLSANVFAQRGYHATSTIELCEANQLGKGALYYYIGSKEELLAAIHDRVMDEVMLGADRVRSPVERHPSNWLCSAKSCSTSSSATPITSGCSCTNSMR